MFTDCSCERVVYCYKPLLRNSCSQSLIFPLSAMAINFHGTHIPASGSDWIFSFYQRMLRMAEKRSRGKGVFVKASGQRWGAAWLSFLYRPPSHCLTTHLGFHRLDYHPLFGTVWVSSYLLRVNTREFSYGCRATTTARRRVDISHLFDHSLSRNMSSRIDLHSEK